MKQKQRLKEKLVMASFVFAAIFSPLMLNIVRAAAPGQVVINEIAWAGSADSSTDEWLELYNNSSQAVDLSNWHIDSVHSGASWKILSGSIAPQGYFLIERQESAVSNVTSDAIIGISLVNSGDTLKLYDSTSQLIDVVNGAGGPWYAGNTTQHATMERIDPAVTTDSAANWASSVGGTGAKSSSGTPVMGTPKAANSKMVSGGGQGSGGQPGSTQQGSTQQNSAQVDFVPDASVLHVGDVVTLTAKVVNVQNLFAYGFDITYDPSVLHYKGSSELTFLSQNGSATTSFEARLKNGNEGTLLVADARTINPQTGVSGSGDLFTMQFDVLSSSNTGVQVNTDSFLASPSGDIASIFNATDLSAQPVQLPAPSGLSAAHGPQSYAIALDWDAVAGAQTYKIYRKDAHGQVVKIGETTQTNFVDQDGVVHGGFIIPSQHYVYEVSAANGSNESAQSEIVGEDDRGLKGDNNRSDLVDGRDLQALANHFAQVDSGAGFDPLVDTTYDGRIDGSDLIDVAANFAHSYTP